MLHIVDDEDVIRDALEWLAQSRGLAARGYAGGQAFLDALDSQRDAGGAQGDCVLLDVRMPGMNGIAVFDQLVARGLLARLPVIFLTGHGDVPMAVDSLKRGAFDFFEKPFNDNQLMDRVEEALAEIAPGRGSAGGARTPGHAVGARARSAGPDPGREHEQGRGRPARASACARSKCTAPTSSTRCRSRRRSSWRACSNNSPPRPAAPTFPSHRAHGCCTVLASRQFACKII